MTDLAYEIVRSRRKTISLQVLPDGSLLVRAPLGMAKRDIAGFVESKHAWVEKHLARVRETAALPPLSEAQRSMLADQAMSVLPQKVRQFASAAGVDYGRITIRCQKTRWGSCSGKGNLNFNCLLMLCPESVQDYVVVHELCHRKEMNHSAAFWAEVERILPGYRKPKQWLREHGNGIIGRMGDPSSGG